MKKMTDEIKSLIKKYSLKTTKYDGSLYIAEKRGFQALSINDKVSVKNNIPHSSFFSYT